jgi:hypothetical protein
MACHLVIRLRIHVSTSFLLSYDGVLSVCLFPRCRYALLDAVPAPTFVPAKNLSFVAPVPCSDERGECSSSSISPSLIPAATKKGAKDLVELEIRPPRSENERNEPSGDGQCGTDNGGLQQTTFTTLWVVVVVIVREATALDLAEFLCRCQ